MSRPVPDERLDRHRDRVSHLHAGAVEERDEAAREVEIAAEPRALLKRSVMRDLAGALEGDPDEWGGGFHWRPASDEPARISIAGWLLADQQSATTTLAHELDNDCDAKHEHQIGPMRFFSYAEV